MISAGMSSIAGAFLSPFPQVVLDKLVNHLVDYLSKDKPSSSSSRDAENHQQMRNELIRDLQRIMNKIKGTLRVAKKLHKKDESVADLLRELKEVVYEAQDLMDDLEYEELHRKVEELNRSQAESSANRSASKRPRLSASDDQTLLELSPDEDFMIKLRNVIGQANRIHSDMKDAIKMATVCLKLDMQQESNHRGEFVTKRFTTSSVNESEIYGRDHERELLTKMLKDSSMDGGIAVFPIIGMGGIGKTTLAQWLFKDLANQFHVTTWICVSDKFDRLRITREMVESLPAYKDEQFPHERNLDLLEREIKENLLGKRLLLVLDDVWSCEWTRLLVTLESSKPACVTIILTTRDPTVLQGKKCKGREIYLKGMEENAYWSLFVSFAFGDEDPHKHPELENIARQIVSKLKTSPLAAKTVGRLLNGNLSEEHWRYVLKSDLWKLETSDPNDIMPILALSYDHLPEHLQTCFGFCSMFPKDYRFQVAELVEMWIAHGYVVEKTETPSLTTEEIGQKYFDELLSRSFFEPYHNPYRYYTIHDLLHDLAQSVSLGEYYVFEDEAENKIPPTVRHLCIRSPLDLRSVCTSKNLRTLFIDKVELPSLELEALKSTRVLVLSDFNVHRLPDAICHMKHLRYLDLRQTRIKSTPEPLCELYHLRLLRLPCMKTLPDSFHNLINLRSFHVEIAGYLSDLYCLEFRARNKNGYMTAQLRNMKELRGKLLVKNLENIKSKEEASKLNMKEKGHLKELVLQWYPDDHTPDDAEKALEGLQPHPKLQVLKVEGYTGSRIPSWFRDLTLQDLREIYLNGDRNCTTSISPIGLLPSLRILTLRDINAEVEASDGTIVMFPALLKLYLHYAGLSLQGISSSTTRVEFSLFPRLSVLSLSGCHQVSGLPLPWLIHPLLEKLYISDSPVLDDQLPEYLRGLTSLTDFSICRSNLTRLPEQVAMTALTSLKSLSMHVCNQLYSVGGLQSLSSLGFLSIYWCPKLTSWSIDETEQGSLLLPELHTVSIESCDSLECLPAWLSCIPSLDLLVVMGCPNIRSLPEAGFPVSLRKLELVRCHPGLIARCHEEGSREWSMIQRIPRRTVY